jgi:hypothetical protein
MWRRALVTAVLLVAAATSLVAFVLEGSSEVPTSPGPQDVWVATNGNDSTCARRDPARPCATLDRARDVARCGDSVHIRAGRYGSQSIGNGTSCAHNPVTFAASLAPVTFGEVRVCASGVTIVGITIRNADFTTQECDRPVVGLTLRKSTAQGFYLKNTVGALLEGNVFDGQFSKNQNWMEGNRDFVLRRNTITRYDDAGEPDNHSEGIFIGGRNDGGLIEGNHFRDSGRTGNLFFSWFGGDVADYPINICVRGNSFERSHNRFYHVQFRPEIPGNASIFVEPPPSNRFDDSAGPTSGPPPLRRCPASAFP